MMNRVVMSGVLRCIFRCGRKEATRLDNVSHATPMAKGWVSLALAGRPSWVAKTFDAVEIMSWPWVEIYIMMHPGDSESAVTRQSMQGHALVRQASRDPASALNIRTHLPTSATLI